MTMYNWRTGHARLGKTPNISIYFFFFRPSHNYIHHTGFHSISDVLFTGGRGVSDFSVLKYFS